MTQVGSRRSRRLKSQGQGVGSEGRERGSGSKRSEGAVEKGREIAVATRVWSMQMKSNPDRLLIPTNYRSSLSGGQTGTWGQHEAKVSFRGRAVGP